MKHSIISILLLISISGFTQNKDQNFRTQPSFRFNTGYSFKWNTPVAGLEFGIRTGDIYIGANLLTRTLTRNATAPVTTGLIAGLNIGQFQPFLSAGWQSIGKENEAKFLGTPNQFVNGWRYGAGLSYYFADIPLSISAKWEGREVNVYSGLIVNF